MAKAPRYEAIVAQTPFDTAARVVVGTLSETVLGVAPIVLRGDDTRAVHDMRVAIRRWRTALTTFKTAFRRKPSRMLRRRVRRLGHNLGKVRDADVHLAVLRAALAGAQDNERPGISYAIETILQQRRRALAEFAIELSQFDRGTLARAVADD